MDFSDLTPIEPEEWIKLALIEYKQFGDTFGRCGDWLPRGPDGSDRGCIRKRYHFGPHAVGSGRGLKAALWTDSTDVVYLDSWALIPLSRYGI